MNYWLIINGVKVGTLNLEQVRAMHLQPSVPVWRTGMADWAVAADMPELSGTLEMPQPAAGAYGAYGPAPAAYPAYGPRPEHRDEPCPPTYLAWSIIVTICCCLIPGIVAIVYSTRVEPLYNRGDYAGARKASETAQLWIIAAVVIGIISLPVQLICALI